MPYNENIPQSTDSLDQSQADLLANFQAINTYVNVNHTDFADPLGEGKHKFLQMPEQGAAPATAANEGGLYTAVGAYSGVTELSYRRESNGTSIPFTEGLNGTNGWARLGNNLLVKWGSSAIGVSGNASAPYTITLPVAANIPAFTTIYQVWTSVGILNADQDVGAVIQWNYQGTTATDLAIRVVSTRTLSGWDAFSLRYLVVGV